MKKSLPLSLAFTCLFAFAALPLSAPAQMNYQGRLTNSAGNPKDNGQYNMTFRLHSAENGGTELWGPFLADGGAGAGHGPKVDLVNGRFNTVLGVTDTAGRSLAEALANNPAAYLGLQLGTESPISPRQQILAAPTALMALTVPDRSITPGKLSAGTGIWLEDANGISKVGGSVGIGAISRAGEKLFVDGNVRVGSSLLFKNDGDLAHGLAWNAKPANWVPAPTATIDGPVLFGYRGGALASVETKNMALRWNAGGVQISGDGTSAWNYPTVAHVGITSNSIYARSNATDMTTLSLSPGGGGVAMGQTSGTHVFVAVNTIQAKSSTAMADLNLNPAGGNTIIGNTSSTAFVFGALRVLGKSTYTLPAHSAFGVNGSVPGGSGSHANVGLYVSEDVVSTFFRAISDERIKKVANRSDAAADLRTLNALEIKNYQFIDAAANGAQPQKKVIAQQVEKVYPQAVALSTGTVPDIYRKAPLTNGWVLLDTDLKTGEKIKLVGKTEDKTTEVKEVRPGAFRPAEAPPGDEVLVYGREVNDFRSVDYDAIAMLNVSATQELARQLKEKDEKIAALEKRLTEIEGAETRLAALEKSVALLVSTAKPGTDGPAEPVGKETAAVR